MTAIHHAAGEKAAASGVEGGIAPRPGGKKKAGAAGFAEGLFASILAQAREALAIKPRSASGDMARPDKLGAARPLDGKDHVEAKAKAARSSVLPDASAVRDQLAANKRVAADAALSAADKPSVSKEIPAAAIKSIKRGSAATSGEIDPHDPLADGHARQMGAANAAKPASASMAEVRPGKAKAEGAADKDEGEGSRARVSVLDLRRSAAGRSQAAAASQAEAAQGASPDAAKGPAAREESRSSSEIVRELGLGPAATDRGAPADKAAAPRAPGAAGGADFASLLAQRLQEAGNGEIVQAAHIVLKDGDAGTIRLKLRPESLGDVKIELNLSEKSISGKIVVESDEAKSAFERNMAELSDAFRQGGFETANLEVSVGSGSGRDAGSAGQGGAAPFFSERLRAADVAVGPAATGSYARRGYAVDILA